MKILNEQKVSDKIYQLLKNTINYNCECREHCVIVRFGTWLDAQQANPITIKNFNAIAEEFKDPDMAFLTGSYEIMLIIQINNMDYYD